MCGSRLDYQRRAVDRSADGLRTLARRGTVRSLLMADQTSSSLKIHAAAADIMDVIADFEAYPQWAQGVKKAEVVEPGPHGRAQRVYFELDAAPIRDQYTLAYDWDGDSAVEWHLVEGKMLRAMNGAYELVESDGVTEVTYRLAVEISIPMIGMLRRKAEKVIIDTALRGLKKRVEEVD
jgi:ribosome-associated toxin RatA of RatAB toxin-antitoxin module